MAYERRSFAGGAPETTLSGAIGSGDTTIGLTSGTGYPTGASGDFFIVIDPGTASEEKVRLSSRTSNSLTVASSGRGADDTTAVAHASGAVVRHVLVALDADEANKAVAETVGQVSAIGQLLVGDGANSMTALANGTTGLPLVAGASTPAYSQVGTAGIADGAISAAKLGTDAVGSAAIEADAVGSSEIAAAAVTASELATDSVITSKILDANVTAGKLATDSVTTGKIADLNVTTGKINDLGVTTGKLAAGAVTSSKLDSGIVDDSTIQFNSGVLRLKDAGITSAKFNSEAATSWTPTVSGTGWAIGNGTVSGIYLKHGRLVYAQASIAFGSTSTFGSGSLTVAGLPVAMNSSVGTTGRAFISDASATTDYYGDWSIAASGSGGVIYANAEFAAPGYVFRTAVTNAIPMTWANGDSLLLSITYIAAS